MSRGDKPPRRAWADFFLEHHRSLTAYALSLSGNMDDAQDLIQDILVRMVEQDPPMRNAKPFVFHCMRNLAIDRRRAARSRPTTMGSNDFDAPCVDVGAAFIDNRTGDPAERESADRVKAALERLVAGRREVIVLKVYGGLTFREIADILDRPIGTVTSHYARGLDELRAIYRREVRHAV